MMTIDAPATETQLLRRIEEEILAAARLRRRLDAWADQSDRGVLRRQLDEIERRIDLLRRHLDDR